MDQLRALLGVGDVDGSSDQRQSAGGEFEPGGFERFGIAADGDGDGAGLGQFADGGVGDSRRTAGEQ